MTDTGADSTAITDAALRLAAERGWRAITLAEIAGAADVPEAELRRHFRCKASVLTAIAGRIEEEAAAQPPVFEEDDSIRDRLFELLMHRLDLLNDHKQAVANILRDLPADPLTTLAAAPAALRLLGGVLEQAGVSASGPVGRLRCKGLGAVWLAALMEWSRDDSPDHARTMAALDANLRRVEPVARFLGRIPFPPASRTAET